MSLRHVPGTRVARAAGFSDSLGHSLGPQSAIMHQVSVQEAKTHLSRLLRRAVAGEDVVITRSGRPVVRLVPVEEDRPVFGIDEGRFVVPDDFDDPLDEELLRAFEGRE